MSKLRLGKGVVAGENVQFGENVVIWNYVVVGDNARVGEGTCVGSFCDIGKDVVIGKNCNIQAHVTISNGCKIGNDVFIAPNSSLLNDKYPRSSLLTPPVVKDHAVIGGGVTVLPDVTIGEKSIVGAGSVVTRTVLPRTVVAGVPARFVMSLQEYEAKQKNYSSDKGCR
jgi:UDP-2-acetamido-3-amino-2,3-dideoxy-glucuronate N-acetyltransferase